MENMQKISILQGKKEIVCIFGGSRKCIPPTSLPQGERYPFLGNGKYAKKNPFYSVKWIFFAYLVAPENAYPTSLPQG